MLTSVETIWSTILRKSLKSISKVFLAIYLCVELEIHSTLKHSRTQRSYPLCYYHSGSMETVLVQLSFMTHVLGFSRETEPTGYINI